MVDATALTAVRIAQGRLVYALRAEGASPWQLHHLGVCSSTETVLTQWLHQQPWLARQPRAVLAQHQRFAHGQYGRFWMAPPGGVWLSAALPWPHGEPSTGLFGLTVALALAEQLERYGVSAAIKWPNDLIVGSRKLAGVLPKLVFRGHHVRLARIGVGLNVRNPVPQGGIALRELLPPGRCRLHVWQLNALLALERASALAADPQRVVTAAEQRLWSTSVADPVSGEHWAVRGIGLDGQLLLGHGTRTTSWTRWGDSSGRNL